MIDENRAEARPRARRTAVIVVAAIAMSAAIVAAAWWLSAGAIGPQPRTVEDLVAVHDDLRPRLATETACAEPRCVEAWRTDIGTYLRFGTSGEAECWAMVLGDDGRRWENIVLDMRGLELAFEERRRAIDVLFAARDWS